MGIATFHFYSCHTVPILAVNYAYHLTSCTAVMNQPKVMAMQMAMLIVYATS